MSFAPEEIVKKFKASESPTYCTFGDLVDILNLEGSISFTNIESSHEEAVYKAVVAAQALYEEGIVDGLKSGEIASAVAVIHTGGPCNPLSYVKDNRTTILENLLQAGGKVVCVYQDKNRLEKDAPPSGVSSKEYAEATARFRDYKKANLNLQDVPVADGRNELTTYLSGASYLVKTKGGECFFYSLKSFQIRTIGKSETTRDWAVWAAPSDNPAVLDRKTTVNSFLMEKAEITLDTLLEHRAPTPPSAKNTPSPH